MTAALTRFRLMAWVVGVYFTFLSVVGLPLKYLTDIGSDELWGTLWMFHGFLFPVYVLTALDLARRARWSLVRTGLVCLAGTIPFLSFVAEHQVTRDTRALLAAGDRSA